MQIRNCICFTTVLLAAFPCLCCPAIASDNNEQFFEAKVRPLLVDRCIPCHGGDRPDAGLSLESRNGWADREVIKAGSPSSSLLMRAVRYETEELQMPPPDSGYEKLTEAELKLFEKWIADGAFDPRSANGASTGPKRRSKSFQINEADLKHWAYQPLKIDRGKSIDQIIDQQLRAAKIIRNPKATPRELVRRAYFDLWGLPPEPEVVEQFEHDHSPAAWSTLVDRLLSSPYYGQRWGRYWLDWVRYAETNGYERDGLKPNAWRYRDYVIASWNADKPYDRFLTEQLAGDLLIDREQLNPQTSEAAWRECIIATGFFRLHVWDDEPDSTEAAELDDLDDIVVTTGASMLGLTLGCARCHDHKFDPLSQADYYSLLDVLRDIDPYGLSKKGGGGRGTGRIERFLADQAKLDSWRSEQQSKIQQIEQQLQSAADDRKESIKQEIKKLRETSPPFEKALAIEPPPTGPKPTYVLARGDYQSPGAKVSPAVPQLFQILNQTKTLTDAATNGPQSAFEQTPEIHNRLDLANWITDKSHPLTARVLANRLWQKHFGAGIAPTTDDFGFTGLPPSNSALLDHLAHRLISNKWSVKALHREIMLSESYQAASNNNARQLALGAAETTNDDSENRPTAMEVDPDNRLFWRQNLRRLDAEAIRDSVLRFAGVLNNKSDGPSVYSSLSQEIRDTANPVSLATWGSSSQEDQNCRSVFLIVKRSLKDPILESFDFANSHSPVGQRPVTTVAPQALMMLNDGFMQKHSSELASIILASTTSDNERVRKLWQIVYQRAASEPEVQAVKKFIDSRMAKQPELRTIDLWTSLCRSILNSNEAIYID
ncbi:MAG: PSD1 and planctomycete cytochrome C domain-containing protein [Pirellulales bacterium]